MWTAFEDRRAVVVCVVVRLSRAELDQCGPACSLFRVVFVVESIGIFTETEREQLNNERQELKANYVQGTGQSPEPSASPATIGVLALFSAYMSTSERTQSKRSMFWAM